MKYKRKKSSKGAYTSYTVGSTKKNSQRGLRRKSATVVITISLIFSLSHFNVINSERISSFFAMLPSVTVYERAVTYFSDKFDGLSDIGNGGADFFYGYLRNSKDNTENVFANENLQSSSAETTEQVSESASDSSAKPDKNDQTTDFLPIYPCDGEISSPFGERVHPINSEPSFHNGIDIAVPEGTEVRCIEDGVAEKSEYNQYSGNYIVIRHCDGYTSSYAHLSKLIIKPGDTVTKGSVIGLSGSTGTATGPHLHMEIRQNGDPVNPSGFFEDD